MVFCAKVHIYSRIFQNKRQRNPYISPHSCCLLSPQEPTLFLAGSGPGNQDGARTGPRAAYRGSELTVADFLPGEKVGISQESRPFSRVYEEEYGKSSPGAEVIHWAELPSEYLWNTSGIPLGHLRIPQGHLWDTSGSGITLPSVLLLP